MRVPSLMMVASWWSMSAGTITCAGRTDAHANMANATTVGRVMRLLFCHSKVLLGNISFGGVYGTATLSARAVAARSRARHLRHAYETDRRRCTSAGTDQSDQDDLRSGPRPGAKRNPGFQRDSLRRAAHRSAALPACGETQALEGCRGCHRVRRAGHADGASHLYFARFRLRPPARQHLHHTCRDQNRKRELPVPQRLDSG